MGREHDASLILSGGADEREGDLFPEQVSQMRRGATALASGMVRNEGLFADDDDSHMYGRLFTVPTGVRQANPTPGPASPLEKTAKLWTVFLQVISIGGSTETASPLVAQITYGIGQATFQKQVTLYANNNIKFNIMARRVEINFFYQPFNPGGPAVVSAAVVPGAYSGADGYAWTWSQSTTGGAPITQAELGILPDFTQGIVGQIHVMINQVAVPGTALWPLLFDQTVASRAALAGAIPLRGGRLGAIFNVGDDRSYTDEQAPGTVTFGTGLVVALSSTPDTYTAPAAALNANQMTVDVKVGT